MGERLEVEDELKGLALHYLPINPKDKELPPPSRF